MLKTGRRLVRLDFLEPIHTDPERKDGVFAKPDPETGFLTLDGRLTTVGIFDYRDADGEEWGELRRPEDVFSKESVDSFRAVVVTNDHPNKFVDVRNVNDVQVGHLGTDVRRDGDFLRATVTIVDAATIVEILAGKKQLSCGYTAVLLDAKGVVDGKRFDAIQTNIRGNHLAIVDVGRAGPECALISRGDGAAFTKGATMATKKSDKKAGAKGAPDKARPFKGIDTSSKRLTSKEIADHLISQLQGNEVEHVDNAGELATEVIEMLQAAMKTGNERIIKGSLLAAAEMLTAPVDEPAPEPAPDETAEGELEAEADLLDQDEEEETDADEDTEDATGAQDSAAATKLRARVDMLEAARKRDKANENKRIDVRVKLVGIAKAICPELDPTDKSDAAIKRAVVLEVSPELKDRLDANKKSAGYLQAAFDAAIDLHTSREEHLDAAPRLAFAAVEHGDDNDPDKAYTEMLARRDERSKPKKRDRKAS